MKFSNAENQQDESIIELTPLIDVVFLLLIFFMVTTTFSKESELKINLPESQQNNEVTTSPETIEVYVNQSSGYAVKSPAGKSPKLLVNNSRETLFRALKPYQKQRDDLLLIIRADKLATHESVVQVMDVAQQVGLTRVTFATNKSNKSQ